MVILAGVARKVHAKSLATIWASAPPKIQVVISHTLNVNLALSSLKFSSIGLDQLIRELRIPGVRSDDGRQIEVVAYNLPLFHGVPLCCDATLVSPLRADGLAIPRAASLAGPSGTQDPARAKGIDIP